MSATDHDWTKPAALAIPRRVTSSWSAGGTARSIPGRRPATDSRSSRRSKKAARRRSATYGKTDPGRQSPAPDVLAPLRLHYLRWVLFDVGSGLALPVPGHLRHGLRQVHRGRDEDVQQTGISTVFTNLEGFPEDWQENPDGVHQVRPRAPVPQLPGVRRVPVRDGRRDQEGAAAQGGVLRHARPDAVTREARAGDARTRRYPAHPADAHTGDDGAL